MKEHPVIFSAPMVNAILEGRKTQTRRIVKLPEFKRLDIAPYDFEYRKNGDIQQLSGSEFVQSSCNRYGLRGDRLWVRETWRKPFEDKDLILYRADRDAGKPIDKWQPSIFMPRAYSRITLKITNVRVERVQSITPMDCRAEGLKKDILDTSFEMIDGYKKLWSKINGTGSWGANPWVWVLEFERVLP